MNHASLCKRTHGIIRRFPPSKTAISIISCIATLLMVAERLSAQPGVPPITITTTSLPNATASLPYLTAQNTTVQLTATGGNGGTYSWAYSFSSNGTDGLSFNQNGTITGTPTTPETVSFEAFVSNTNSDGGGTSANLQIVVAACVPTISPASPLPQGEVSVFYSQINFTASGCPGPYTYSAQPVTPFASTALPPGLFLSTNGALKGTPASGGTFNFLLDATDTNQKVAQFQYSITILPLPTISTPSPLPTGPVGVFYSQQIAATGGTPPYIFSMNNNPPGITISAGGVLMGTPTKAGTYSFNIGVTDNLRVQTVSPFQVTFVTTVSELQVAPLSLTFNAILNGNTPPTQAIAVVPASGATPPVNFRVRVDSGQSNSQSPSWITVTPTNGNAPAGLVVSVNQGNMPAGSYPARIQILDPNGIPTAVSVTLNVASASQQLTVAPAILNFSARAATPGSLIENLVLSSSGAGAPGFSTSVVGKSGWISSVTPTSSTTTANAPAFVQVQVDTTGLPVGAYHDAILVSSSAGNTQIPVSLFVAANGPILAVDTTGVLFQAVEDGGSTATQSVKILNLGDPSSTVDWSATLFSGSNWLNLVSSSGTATTSTPGTLTLALAPNATQLTPGPYYALIKIIDSNSLNSPQYVVAVLNLQTATSAPMPYLTPGGLFFTGVASGSAPPAQQVQVNTSSSAAVTFNAAATTMGNGGWLNVTPASGNASGQTVGSISVSVNPTGLAAGIYSGDVNVSIGALLQSVNVTFIVEPAGSSSASLPSIGRVRPEAAGCTASKLAITETGLANNFAVPAGWPATLIVQLNDDCAAAVNSGNVVASFSNGDAPLNLAGDSLGNYSATWQPGAVNANMVITLNATANALQPATAMLYGGIDPNQTPPPTLAAGGTLNNLNPVVGAALAPGTIAQVYGSGLSPSSASTGAAPLPITFHDTFALIGFTQAPLYSLSSGQIDLQIPYEATATQQLPIVLSVNNALTLPQLLNIIPTAPGVLSDNHGPTPPSLQNRAHIIAQHSADFSLVTSSNPAKPGEYVVMYLVGLGDTDPSVASGAASPGPPSLANVTVTPIVTVDSQLSTVTFAGLAPFFVGLYQIDFQVPTSAASGDLEVDVTQNGVAANPTLLPVAN